MPVSFLSPTQRERYGRYDGEPSAEQLARYFHLDKADRLAIADKRGEHNRVGYALQLTTVRFLGTFPEDLSAVPAAVLQTLRRQFGFSGPDALIDYARGEQRWEHAEQIRIEHGYSALNDRQAGFALARRLFAQCWTGTDRPRVLFDRATSWMLAQKVLLPGASVLERFVARLRERMDARLCRLLGSQLTSTQQTQLEALLQVPRGHAIPRSTSWAAGPSGSADPRSCARSNGSVPCATWALRCRQRCRFRPAGSQRSRALLTKPRCRWWTACRRPAAGLRW